MTVLPSAYLPPISYFCALLSSDGAVIDLAEHYIKRSLRNRTQIMTAQGVMALTIPVKNANRPRQPMLSIEIDNSKRWQHQHWITILSAYRSSPYFEHYAPYIEPLYRREWQCLVEFNEALMEVVVKLLKMGNRTATPICAERSTTYINSDAATVDLRPKGALALAVAESAMELPRYMQVFGDRLPFEADMSILDLLFCEGTNSLALLMASRR